MWVGGANATNARLCTVTRSRNKRDVQVDIWIYRWRVDFNLHHRIPTLIEVNKLLDVLSKNALKSDFEILFQGFRSLYYKT